MYVRSEFAKCVCECGLCVVSVCGECGLRVCSEHSWAQRKLSLLNPLNILLSIIGPLLSYRFNGLND